MEKDKTDKELFIEELEAEISQLKIQMNNSTIGHMMRLQMKIDILKNTLKKARRILKVGKD